VIAGLFAAREPHDEEFLLCLVQEAVARHGTLDREPFLSLWSAAAEAGHPLTWLPLRLMDVEIDLPLRHYSLTGQSFSLPFGPELRAEELRPAAASVLAPRVSSTEPVAVDVRAASSVIRAWHEASNGKFECRGFRLHPTETSPLGESLVALDLACLAGAQAPTVHELETEHAFRILFGAASTGGAYTWGAYAAYGRLQAWRSVGALTGSGPEATIEAVEGSVRETQWYWFESRSQWFHHVAWDIGLVAVRPDRASVAILAATDTD
jgi:hypothetical protein